MANSLPPFAVTEIHEDQGLSVVQVNERQYQATVDLHPEAALSYLDDDDGERVTIGSGLELRQRLDEPANPIGPFVHCYNSAEDKFEERTLHIFELQKTTTSRALWESLKTRYEDEKRQFESEQAKTETGDSISSIDLNSDLRDEHEHKGNAKSQQSQSTISKSESSDTKFTAALSDAIPDLVENLANIMQTTSDTLRKAAQKSRGSKTTPVEDVLSGMSNIVAEIGGFGLSLLDQLNRGDSEEVSEYEPLAEDSMQASQVSIASVESEEFAESSPVKIESSVDSLPSKASIVEPEVVLREVLDTKPSVCNFCATCKLQCRRNAEYGDACHNCLTLGQPCSLDHAAVVPPMVAFNAPHDIPSWKDDSILDQDTEDAEFSRRFPPLMSLRRANTVAGLRDRFEGSEKLILVDHGPNRGLSWARRFPHRPIPQVLDEETKRRKNFAQNCFPGQEYTPGLGVQETGLAPMKDFAKHATRRFPDIESQLSSDLSSKSADHVFSKFEPREDVQAVESKFEPSVTVRKTTAREYSAATLGAKPTFDLKRKSLPGAWPESTDSRLTGNAPAGESSGAFFNRMMRDNPSRRQNAEAEINDRLTRHRSFTKNQRSKNPFRDLNRSHTVSKADDPASRLNGPFNPVYPIAAKETRLADRAPTITRPFSPVWEDDLGQTSNHSKDKNEKTGFLDRNGESTSMYSPPPRHMRSVPNFATVARIAPESVVDAAATASVSNRLLKSAYTPPKSEDAPSVPYQVMFQRQGSQASLHDQLPTANRGSITHKNPDTSPAAIRKCVKSLRDMGFGLTDRDLAGRLRVYAILANGNITEAVELIEEDRQASYR